MIVELPLIVGYSIVSGWEQPPTKQRDGVQMEFNNISEYHNWIDSLKTDLLAMDMELDTIRCKYSRRAKYLINEIEKLENMLRLEGGY